MKTFISTILILILAAVLIPAKRAEAHFLQISNSIGAVLHIDPDDDPIAKETSSFYFEFKDDTEKFIAQECNCILTISNLTTKKVDTIPQKDIGFIQTSTIIFKYIFAERGIYRIEIDGKPMKEANFSPFRLTYDIRVDRESSSEKTQYPSHILHYIIFGGGILATIYVVIRDKRREIKV